jgi:MFS family permease
MPDKPEKNPWRLVSGLGLVVFMATLDSSAVAIALPAIERGYGVATTITQWVLLGYLLPLVALTLPAGRWLDQVGPRAALTFLTSGFGVTSLIAGLAPGIGSLIAARAAQGVFAGALFALGPMIVAGLVRPEVRGRALGVITTLGPLGAVTGPAAGGLIVQYFGWQWIFYLNVPVCLMVILIALTSLPRGRGLRLPSRSLISEAVVLGTALVAFMLGFSLAPDRGLTWAALALVAVPPLIGWSRMESSRTTRAVLGVPGMSGPIAALLLSVTAAASIDFVVTFYLQRVLGASPSAAGLTLLAFPIGMVAAGLLGGVLADRWNARRAAMLGLLLLVAGMLLLLPLGEGWTLTDVRWRLALAGAGLGLFNGPNVTLIMSRTPAELRGTAGATQSLARQLGFSVAPALVTMVWALSGYTVAGLRTALILTTSAALLALVSLRPQPVRQQ